MKVIKRIIILGFKALRKPPKLVFIRACQEIKNQLNRYLIKFFNRRLSIAKLLNILNQKTLDDAWTDFSERKLPFAQDISQDSLEKISPNALKIIEAKAQKALNKEIDLLGSGAIMLGDNIVWCRDYKTDIQWDNKYYKDFNYNNPELPSDVKFPWELSRLQWLIPVAQMYILTKDEKYATFAKDIIEDWIDKNPHGYSVNWSCTMEAAIRVFSFTYFFDAFKNSVSWKNKDFQFKYLKNLYLHGKFVVNNIEISDVNGNHFTADAAAIVWSGLFFENEKFGKKWLNIGINYLENEIPKQIFPDGVDFEASVPYHRLVAELFYYPQLFLKLRGKTLSKNYLERLKKMTVFCQYYTRNDGSSPLFGDADDARTLPLGIQNLCDHRYLGALIGTTLDDDELISNFSGDKSELYWLYGEKFCQNLPDNNKINLQSKAFSDGGFYVIRNDQDHLFIDCGPVGMNGRGGHGHNDILSFEAMLNNELLISDCGAYVYTASYKERNLFRSTANHNTPQIDNQEINRFLGPDMIWSLIDDSKNHHAELITDDKQSIFCGSHAAYARLDDSVTIKRKITLNHLTHKFTLQDEISGEGIHDISIPFHLTNDVEVNMLPNGEFSLQKNQKQFILSIANKNEWNASIQKTFISPSYGVKILSSKIVFNKKIDVKNKVVLKMILKKVI